MGFFPYPTDYPPPDPAGEDWRGEPGPPGPPGPEGPPGEPGSVEGGGTLAGPLFFAATGATESRSIQDRAAEPYSVRDFGAVMDGTTSDQAAMTAAFAATPAFGTIRIPAGNINPGAFSPTSKAVLWELDGTYTGSATTPFSGIGNSVIESFLPNATKFFARGSTTGATALGPVLRTDMTVSHAGGASGTISAFVANLQSTAGYTGNMGLIGAVVNVTNARTSGGAESTGIMATAIRPANGSGAGIYGANIIADDRSLENSSQSGSAVGLEINTKANGLDDGLSADGFNVPGSASGPNLGASRVLLDLKYGRSIRTGAGLATAEWSNIFNIGIVDTDTSWNQAKNYIRLTGKATFAGINMLHLDLTGAQALALQTEQSIGWSVAALNSVPAAASWRSLQYTTTGTPRLRYMVGATERFTLPDAKPAVAGAKGGNAALASLLAALVAANLVTDSTTA